MGRKACVGRDGDAEEGANMNYIGIIAWHDQRCDLLLRR